MNRSIHFLLAVVLLVSPFFVEPVPSVEATSDPIENWAIIVTGSDGSDAWYNGSMTAYNALLNIGYTNDTIYYLDVVNRGPFDDFATKQNINSSITNWLATNSDGNDVCVILFNSHGSDLDFLYVNNNTENLYYSEINQYLQSVEYGRLVIVVDACYSGTSIDDLNGTDRVIISSANADQQVGISLFSNYFWSITVSKNIMQSFNNASWEAWNFTKTYPFLPEPQTAQIDDNNDGVGNWSPSDPLPNGGDGYLAKATYLNPAEMVNLDVSTEGTDGTELTNVDVTINVTTNEDVGSLYRLSPVHIILSKDSYTVEVDTSVTQGGYTWNFDHWEDDSTSNPRNLTLYTDKTVTAYYETGGCPYVYVWNGQEYVVDNNLLGYSEATTGADVEDYYRLEQTLVPRYEDTRFSWYSLQISEFEQEHSYIDQVKLIAVDHESDVNIAVSPYGEFLTYREPSPPISCIDNHGNNQLAIINTIDDNYYRSRPEDHLTLDFGDLDISNGAKLVLRANAEWKKELCIHIQAIDSTGSWMDVIALRTRVRWATEIVDLSGYLPDANGELKVRLYFTGIHKLDYVGLDTSPQEDFELHYAHLVSATHSAEGNVKQKLMKSDGVYAELTPDQQIELTFLLPNDPEEARTFIIYIEGHYETIP